MTNRRNQKKQDVSSKKKDMLDNLIDTKDENGRTLEDDEIIDVLLMYLNAGHESSGHIIMWATIFLQEHPEILQKAKVKMGRYMFLFICFFFFIFNKYKLLVVMKIFVP